MPKRLGKVASRSADIGDSVVVGAKIADDTITLADMLEYHTSSSIPTTTGVVINHALGSIPSEIVVTQISSAKLGHLHYCGADTSNVIIGTDVSGSFFLVVCRV